MSILAMALATSLLVPLWMGIRRGNYFLARVLAASQVAFVLLGWFRVQFPVLIASNNPGRVLTIYNSSAPETVLRVLTFGLVFGSALIFPALFYLFKVFKSSENKY